MFVSCLVQGGRLNCGAFVALKAERSNILILGATGPDEDTGGVVTYMHLHLHPHIQYWDGAYLILARSLKTGCAVTYKHHHTRTNMWMFDDMQKFTVFAILPERFVQSGELFIGQVCVCVCVGGVNSYTRPGSNITCRSFVFQTTLSHGVGGARWIMTMQMVSAKLPVEGKIPHGYFPVAVWAFCQSFCCLMWQTPPVCLPRAFITPWKAFWRFDLGLTLGELIR